ncbi:MAG: hypothetical protein JNM84_26600 [Planctomycetes bacterium]|nr:hypothetical protein [Planctomycetota bacterium]
MSDSGHLLDALKGRQPDDDDPEHRLASQWLNAAEGPSSIEREAAARRARFRRPASSAEAGEADAGAAEEHGAPLEAVPAALPAEESGEVRRTRIVAAPEATRPKADEPKRSAFAGLGAMRQAVSSALGSGRAKATPAAAPAAAPASERSSASPRASAAKPRGKVQLSHSEALLFVLVALIVVLSAYVIGKNGTRESQAGAPSLLSRVAPEGGPGGGEKGDPKQKVDPPTPPPGPEEGPEGPKKNPEAQPAAAWGVRVTSYADKAEAEKQAGVFREGLAAGEEITLVERPGRRGPEYHLFVGRSEKKEDPALAALLEKFRTVARNGGQKPYARSAEIQGF